MLNSDLREAEQSASPFIVHRVADRYSVVTAFGILCHNVSRATATVAVVEAGADPSILDSPAAPNVFRSTFMAATANELEAINATLETLPQSSDVEAIKTRQEIIAENLATLSANIAAEKSRRAEIAELEADLQRRFPIIKQALPGTPSDAEVWIVLNATAQAKRLRELR